VTHRRHVLLCDLTTCYCIESAWFHHLKLQCDEPLSNFAFKFNLRRYNMAVANAVGSNVFDIWLGLGLPWLFYLSWQAGAYTLPLFSST